MSDNSAPEVPILTTHTVENKSSDLSHVGQPKASESQQLVQPPKKKGFSCLLALIIGLLLLCCLCVASAAAILAFAPDTLKGILFQNTGNATNSPELTESQIEQLAESYENKLNQIENSQNSTETLVLKEDELRAAMIKNADLPAGVNIGIDIRPGSAELTIPFDDILNAIGDSSSSEMEGFDVSSIASLLSGVNLRVTLGTTPDGKNIILQDFSTGNSFIDDMLKSQVQEGFNEESFGSLDEITGVEGFTINKIEFREGEMVLDLARN